MQSHPAYPAVVLVSGSPSDNSKTAALTDHIAQLIEKRGFATKHIKVRDLPSDALLRCDFADPELAEAMKYVEHATGVVIATPTYKAAYSGILKSFLDMMPQFGLAGKSVMPFATGGTLAHVLSLDYALRPVLHSMNARHVVQSCFVVDTDLTVENGEVTISEKTGKLLDSSLTDFCDSLRSFWREAAE
jgi:FMN reductase